MQHLFFSSWCDIFSLFRVVVRNLLSSLMCKQYFVSICHSIFHLSKLIRARERERLRKWEEKCGNHQREYWSIGWLPISRLVQRNGNFPVCVSLSLSRMCSPSIVCWASKNAKRPSRYFNNKINLYMFFLCPKAKPKKTRTSKGIHVRDMLTSCTHVVHCVLFCCPYTHNQCTLLVVVLNKINYELYTEY